MSSDEIKEMLVDRYEDTTVSDWKRISKKKYGDQTVRLFQNQQNQEVVWVFGEADDEEIYRADTYLYHVWHMDGELWAAFNPVSYWMQEQCLWDRHLENLILTVYPLPNWLGLSEVAENQFIITLPQDKTLEDVKAAFEAVGFLYNEKFSKFMDQHCS